MLYRFYVDSNGDMNMETTHLGLCTGSQEEGSGGLCSGRIFLLESRLRYHLHTSVGGRLRKAALGAQLRQN